MPSPPNQTALTARVITTLPYEIVEDVADQPDTLQLWYTYTGQADDRMIGALPYADISSVYEPQISVYTGPASAPVSYHITNSKQRAVQVPSNTGIVYLFKVTQSGAGTPLAASLTFRLDRAPQLDAPAGSIISTVVSASTDWRTPIVSASTPQVLQFIADDTFNHAVTGRMLDTGVFICDAAGDGVNPDLISIYNSAFTRIYHATPTYFAFTPSLYTSNNANRFYLLYNNGAGIKEVRVLEADGSETTDAWTLPAATGAATIDRSDAILYYGTAALAVARYDLVNAVGLTDLAASIGAGYNVHPDMCVMVDGSILVGYYKVGGSPDNLIMRYSPAGAVLNTYNFGGISGGLHHFATGPDPLTFYVWILETFITTNDRCTYYELLASDGSTVRSAEYDLFNAGPDAVKYDPTYAAIDDVPRFGPEASCTFFVTRASVAPSNPIIYPSFNLASDMIRRVRQAPHLSNEQRWNYYRRFMLDMETGQPRTSSTHDLQLQWSDDGGHTWSNLHAGSYGNEGQYRSRMVWRQLGRSRDRIFRVIDSTDDKAIWIDAFIDVEPGAH